MPGTVTEPTQDTAEAADSAPPVKGKAAGRTASRRPRSPGWPRWACGAAWTWCCTSDALRGRDHADADRRSDPRAGLGQPAQIEGEVISSEVTSASRRQLVVTIADDSGELTLRFLNFYGSQTKQMAEGTRLRVRGDVRGGFFGAEMVHPTVRPVTPDEPPPDRLTPVYPATAGISRAYLRKAISGALSRTPLPQRRRPARGRAAGPAREAEAAPARRMPAPAAHAAAAGERRRRWPTARIRPGSASSSTNCWRSRSRWRAHEARREKNAPSMPRRDDGLLTRLPAALPFRLDRRAAARGRGDRGRDEDHRAAPDAPAAAGRRRAAARPSWRRWPRARPSTPAFTSARAHGVRSGNPGSSCRLAASCRRGWNRSACR
ncbi:hypothetical protein ACTMU2_33430 [Cupriavidus basilensis]